MARRIEYSTLNASSIDIINVIRQNASQEYQDKVPKVEKASDIPKVGEVIYGTPAFANQFVNSLVNRIAAVRIKTAVFYNPYAVLKKGYLEFGETIEEIFVNIAKVVEYSAEKAEQREFKRWLPDVRSAFHTMNWRVMYPVTVQNRDLKLAFLSVEGVTDLIAKIVDSVYKAAAYDEFLLFKYMIIKAVSHGKMKTLSVGALLDTKEAAVEFRGYSNALGFMADDYNEAGVLTNTPREKQVIFMDAMFNAKFDVDVLSAAFNMDKADYMGRLFLIDRFDSFDNKRFETIRKESNMLEEVTTAELELMKEVKAILLDEDWFQVYDEESTMTETYVSSGLYWNYYYHDWKTFSHSPYSNALCFVTDTATIALPTEVTVEICDKSISEEATVFTLEAQDDNASLQNSNMNFVQTEALTAAGIAIQRYGAVIIPASQSATEITLVATIGGQTYTAETTISAATNVGSTVKLTAPAARAKVARSK